MKVLLVVDDYMPASIKIGAKMMHELACELLRTGHEVTVLTPSPDLVGKSEIATLDGVTTCRFKTGPIKNTGNVQRAINETLLSARAWRSYKTHFSNNPHDLIVYYSPTIFWGKLVKRLSRMWQVPCYLVLRDFFPQWAIDNKLLRKKSLVTAYFKYFEKHSYRQADRIGVMSPKNLEWFSGYHPTKTPVEVLYNWADQKNIAVATNKYRSKLALEDKIVFFYGGNMGHAQDMMNVIRLAKNMRNEERAYFVLVGMGDEVELLRQAIKEEELSNMSLLPPVDQEEFKLMIAEFDVGIFTLHKDHITHNFPGKLLGYMAQAMPILGSINLHNDLQATIESAGAGLVSINGEDEVFLHQAQQMLDKATREQMGAQAAKLLDDVFSVKSAALQILSITEAKR